MELLCDCRESSIIDIFSKNNTKFNSAKLDVGDFQIKYNDTLKTVIERKTINDLVSSIMDGRYKEQSYRLSNLNELKPYNIYYLIEGDLNTYKPVTRIKTDGIRSAMLTLSYYKGFNVVNTKNKNETADFIKLLFDKISKKPKDNFYTHDGTVNSDCDYVNVVKQIKKDNINKNNISCLMLSQIPGISPRIANSILNVYTFKQLVNGTFEIKDITYLDSNRKIPKKSLSVIKDFLSNI